MVLVFYMDSTWDLLYKGSCVVVGGAFISKSVGIITLHKA